MASNCYKTNKVFGDNYCVECSVGNGCHCKKIFGACRKKLPCMKESKPRPLSFVCILYMFNKKHKL